MDATYEGAKNTELPYESVHIKKVSDYNYLQAGFWIRFWAYIIDLLVIGSVNRIIIYPVFQLLGLDTNTSFMFSPVSIATAVIFFAYFVLMTKNLNQTLGKMVFGIKVISAKDETLNWGTILFRELIGRYISKTIWIGYLIVAFTPKKQGLHDIFADTQVIHEKLFIKKSEDKPAE
ncbi:RDD family protein [uncultured Metabacillus sp.]|uniref:RDD family protein n=1 Tax=Metabacillus sp. Hm71 TaxID=3450743 RepID=UPI002608CABD|nr:RDD family protein [uncultured Metabacillus sp.]